MGNRRRQRGAAMTETVLALPLILLLLALMLFFGQNMQRLQRVAMTGRYEAWRQMDEPRSRSQPQAESRQQADRINDLFFAGRAEQVSVQVMQGRATGSEQLLTQAAATHTPDALEWMRSLLAAAQGTRGVGVEARFDDSARTMRRFVGPMRHHTVVLDGDWRYAPWLHMRAPWPRRGRDVVWVQIHEVFYADMGARFEPLVSAGNVLAEAVWEQHEAVPAYEGPGDAAYWRSR